MADNASTTNTPSDAQARSKPPTNLSISFSPFNGGDVKISAIFQGHKVAGKVAAQAMVLASPARKRFLFPPWNVDTGDKTQAKAVDFTEDDGCALLILLRLAHIQFPHVPSKISPDTLFQVAILCEKYECFDLVDPWLEKWINRAKSTAMADETGTWLEYIKHSCYNDQAYTGNDLCSGRGIPNSGTNSLCYAKKARFDARDYGSLLLGLKKACLWPERKDMTYTKSVAATAKCIRSVAIHTLQPSSSSSSLFGNPELQRHKMCTTPTFWAEIDRIVAKMPSPVLERHTRHMEALRSCTVAITDPLMHETLSAKCSQTHSAMVACAPNDKKRTCLGSVMATNWKTNWLGGRDVGRSLKRTVFTFVC
ncbi:hypothetical protein IFR04_007009 [Cadophora malorum]|uniref:BTB domain-containing protein n=1 Tax=Cadophora malorum TaxID=108018 RepID=A0A8H7W927_9HELO|nr:hypothetical protein IFR04_007009 [Cadophora malorum]